MNELRRYSRKSTKFYGTSFSSASRRSRISSTTSSSRTSSTITPTQQSLNLDEVLLINLFLETKVNQNACEKVSKVMLINVNISAYTQLQILFQDVRSVLEDLSMTRKYQKIFAEQEIDIQVFQSLSTVRGRRPFLKS